jgi:hypothetical protein
MVRLLNRRIVLRGVGGAAVAAPFLSSLVDRRAKAQAAAPPKRLLVMFTHYGCITNRFFPAKSHGSLTAADLEATTLAPLMPYVDKLLMPRGIRAMNEWTSDMQRGQGNEAHTQTAGSYFTCQPVTPNSNDPFGFEENSRFKAKPVGPSLDHVIAQQLASSQQPLVVRVGNRTEDPRSAISYSAAETQYPGFGLPVQVLTNLTGLFDAGTPLSPDSYAVLRGKSIVDIVRADLDTLERIDMSQSDKLKLAAWKELLDETGTTMATSLCNEEVANRLGATEENVAAAQSGGSGDSLTRNVPGTTLDQADIYANVAVLAAACNANPVIVLKYPAYYTYSGLGIDRDAGGLAHRTGSGEIAGNCLAGVLDLIATIDAYHARKFAHLVGQLDSIDEGEGKLLDNCAAVWFQEMSDGCAHNLNNLPIVQVGSAGGYFKTGLAVNVDDGAANLTRGNSEFYCAAGESVSTIGQSSGTSAEYANAPINKYFVNLMNALGVRAGSDGFPAPGGQAEVTHFGMYDRTEDFIGGGTNPPMIRSPGGFDALKANV